MRLKFLPSFVKRRGRITNNQEENLKLLPDYSINTLDDIEFHSSEFLHCCLEIGFGYGENLIKLSNEKKFSSVFPPINLCSDNAAMIAWAGIERYKINLIDNLEFPSRARWPLDSFAPFLKGPGLKI